VWKLISNRMSPTAIIAILFVVGIVASLLGILAPLAQ